MAQKIKAVIWDMGGVILRTEGKTSREQLAKKYNVSLDALYDLVFDSETAKKATLGLIEEQVHWQTIAKTLGIHDDGIDEFREKFWEGDQIDIKLIDFIESLRKVVKTGLLSNAWSGARNYLCQRINCDLLFQYSIFSCEVGLRKPDARIYNLMLNLMKVEADEAIFVDDFLENIEAANAVGIHGVRFATTEQAMAEVVTLLEMQL
jgi:epoxide hydrolase-like predicted phosphatase